MKKILASVFGDTFIYRIKDIKAKWLPSSGQKIAKEIEEKETAMRMNFYAQFVKSGDLCFDVGANMGNRISPLLKIGAKVVAVEPQEKCVNFLKYKFSNKINIVQKGLGEREEIKDFHIANFDVLSSFSDKWINSVKNERFKHVSWSKKQQVEMTTLDKLIEIYGVPSFIKIDVEGYELEVLKGLNQPIKMISFEYTFPELMENAFDCINQIEKINGNIECNYGAGEEMQFVLTEWLSPTEIKTHFKNKHFTTEDFGDIYIRTKV